MPDRRFLLSLLSEHRIVEECLQLAHDQIRRASSVAAGGTLLADAAGGHVGDELARYAAGLREYSEGVQQRARASVR